MTNMKERARALRKNMTDAENRIWFFLRDRRLNGHKFLRQKIIGNYIVDFVCQDKKLIVELDGGQHSENIDYDNKRTTFLIKRGYTVMRIWNNEVFSNTDGVLEGILMHLESEPHRDTLTPRPSPASGRGE